MYPVYRDAEQLSIYCDKHRRPHCRAAVGASTAEIALLVFATTTALSGLPARLLVILRSKTPCFRCLLSNQACTIVLLAIFRVVLCILRRQAAKTKSRPRISEHFAVQAVVTIFLCNNSLAVIFRPFTRCNLRAYLQDACTIFCAKERFISQNETDIAILSLADAASRL